MKPVPRPPSIARSAAANFAYFGLQAVVLFFTFPVVINHFGRAQYGIFSLVVGVGMFFQFFNLGLNLSLMKYVAECRAAGDTVRLQAILASSYALAAIANGAVGAVIMLVGVAGASFLGIEPAQEALFQNISLIVGLGTILNGVLTVPRGILAGLQQFALRAKLDLVSAGGPVLGVVAIWAFDARLEVFVLIGQLTMAISGIAMLRASKRVLPDVRHAISLKTAELRSVLSFNAYQVGSQVAAILFYTTDRLILQRLYGSVMVGNYAIAIRANQLAETLISLPMSPLVPASSKAYAEGDKGLLDRLLLNGTRIHIALVLPPLLVGTFLMRDFLRFWIGPGFVDLAWFARLFLIAEVASVPFRLFSHLMIGKGRMKEIVRAKLIYAPVNVIVSYFLAREFGLIGVIIPTLAYWAILSPFVWMSIMKDEGIDRGGFVKRTMPVAISCLLGAAGFYAGTLFIHFANTGLFVLYAGTAVLSIYGAVYLLVLNRAERDVFLRLREGIFQRV